MSKCQNAKMSKCPNVKMPKCQNVKMSKCQIVDDLNISMVILLISQRTDHDRTKITVETQVAKYVYGIHAQLASGADTVNLPRDNS